MKQWQAVAEKMLPELRAEIKEAETPMALWVEIIFYFDEAYRTPQNDDFIRRVYAYADWCLGQNTGETAAEHLQTCVAVCFWEHIPNNKAARSDMPRWLSFEDLMANQHFFRYSLSDEAFDELKALYSDLEGPR